MLADFENGAVFRQPAWEGQAVTLATPPTSWAEARELAGLTWEPVRKPLYEETTTPAAVGPGGELLEERTYTKIDGYSQVVRSDNGHRLFVGPDTYELITNSDLGLIMDAVLGEGHPISIIGAMEGGKKVWALFNLGYMEIPGDPSPTLRYAAVMTAHDATMSCTAIQTSMRIRCSNAFHLADVDAKAKGYCYKFRHVKGWRGRIDKILKQAREAIFAARQQADGYYQLARDLAEVHIPYDQAEAFLDEAIHSRKTEHKLSPGSLDNVLIARKKIRAIYESPTCGDLEPTGYKLLQAAGEYWDHEKGWRSRDSYINRTLIEPQKAKLRAVELAFAAADGRL